MNDANANMFEVAVRNAFRFPFKGSINVEDLWQLSVKDLDQVFKTLNSQLKESNEESLLEIKSKQDQELDTKIEIVKYIVKVKLEEQAAKLRAKELKEFEQRLLEIKSNKQNAKLQEMSIEEIDTMLANLGK